MLARLEMMLPYLTGQNVEQLAQSPLLLSGLVQQIERLVTDAGTS